MLNTKYLCTLRYKQPQDGNEPNYINFGVCRMTNSHSPLILLPVTTTGEERIYNEQEKKLGDMNQKESR